LVQFAEQLQGHWIVRFEAGGELVHQAGLTLDQGILVTGEQFEFLDQGAVGLKAAQIGQIASARFRQQIGINGIGFGPCRIAATIHCLGVDGVNREARFEQGGNEQSLVGLQNASHLVRRGNKGEQEARQVGQAFFGVRNAPRSHLMPCLIDNGDIMVLICPVNASIPHAIRPPDQRYPGPLPQLVGPYTWVLAARPSHHHSPEECYQGSAIFLHRSSRVEGRAFP
jgi:hypothetical protein